ncbi:UDP-2,4-diacetamido-2,4,6-trideoxy-beta-L-altropyranose hydrolase [Gracilibacillus oryzae]|uniref:UDP-2,4-diacetamido-2,4, 6-trideoxy-beta-L-altropyranose hydrolase n=1 Tax=Gracilibacillus oryzae TaxID=1672701 RepID=A0A7C8KQ57_9BACI|nr:UDP-2,4-diacetamido-2,4,6-trideoxy-beta-L-altropyranose hydrolase [Gracilibacillus oryzae]KAB8135352.1 UDP-2,4-diacetamido-2,4,6-trideoxy-beta-L-altropyranose hydrolase [Gracilibacillus oryzae]
MQVIIRADASSEMGTGHVMRCLVLGKDLVEFGADVAFICRKLPGNLIEKIENDGFPVYEVSDDRDGAESTAILSTFPMVDWLIVDHYELDRVWEEKVKHLAGHLLVIDDLADRPHLCDVLVDQNYFPHQEKRYESLVSEHTVKLLGICYLLLRHEFRQTERKRQGPVKKVLLSFGGSDPTNETMKALEAIAAIPEIEIDVIIGAANPYYQELKAYCEKQQNIQIHYQINYLARLMSEADIAIGAGGTTTWERIYMLLPTLTIETAANQSEILAQVAKEGLVCHLGKSEQVTSKQIREQFLLMISQPQLLAAMSKKAETFREKIDPLAVARFIMKGES